MSSDIQLRAISQEIPQPWITKISLEIICLKLYSNLLGVKELINTKMFISLSTQHYWDSMLYIYGIVKSSPLGTYKHDLDICGTCQRDGVWFCSIINTLRPTQNGCHFADSISRHIFFNENGCISINISLNFVPKGQINNISALVQIMAWRRPGDKPLSEPVIVYQCIYASLCLKELSMNLSHQMSHWLDFYQNRNDIFFLCHVLSVTIVLMCCCLLITYLIN